MQIKALYFLLFLPFKVVPYGLEVRIPGFHPGGPCSTPGMGISIFDSASSVILSDVLVVRLKQRQWYLKEI